jgi:hypothetical protein
MTPDLHSLFQVSEVGIRMRIYVRFFTFPATTEIKSQKMIECGNIGSSKCGV